MNDSRHSRYRLSVAFAEGTTSYERVLQLTIQLVPRRKCMKLNEIATFSGGMKFVDGDKFCLFPKLRFLSPTSSRDRFSRTRGHSSICSLGALLRPSGLPAAGLFGFEAREPSTQIVWKTAG